jgi:hypothetical protein
VYKTVNLNFWSPTVFADGSDAVGKRIRQLRPANTLPEHALLAHSP